MKTRNVVTFKQRRKIRRVDVERAPRLGLIRPTRLGFRLTVRLHDGQTPEDYARVLDRLAHAWKVHSVRLASWTPGKVVLVATLTDPLAKVNLPVLDDGLLRVQAGVLDTSEPFVIDFRAVPHWMIVGATQSGKSNLANAMFVGLAPQPVALVGFDLKGGVEFTPYERRMSALATERDECIELLADVIGIIKDRMALCRSYGVKNIWHPRIPDLHRPIPIVVFVDELAELFLMADKKKEQEQVMAVATRLLRVAQIGRAFGIHLVVCGQRIGSDLGSGVTALRAQLTGRICHKVNDEETAKMALGDMDPAAVAAARQIPASMPGTAIVIGADGRWHRMRSVYVSEEEAEAVTAMWAHLTPSWEDLTGRTSANGEPGDTGDVDPDELEEFSSTDPDETLV